MPIADAAVDLSVTLEEVPIALPLQVITPLPLLENQSKSIMMTIQRSGVPLCSQWLDLSSLLAESESFEEWFSIPWEEAAPFKLLLSGWISNISLNSSSLFQEDFKHKYLISVLQSESLISEASESISSIQTQMGSMFHKVLEESIRLRSPIKSPGKPAKSGKKKKSSTKTPKSTRSPYTIGNQVKQEPTVTVNSRHCFTMDRLSSSDISSLVSLILGINNKKQTHAVMNELEKEISVLMKPSDESASMLAQATNDTIQQGNQHFSKVESYMQVLSSTEHENVNFETKIKQQLELREGLQLVLNKITNKANFEVESSDSFFNKILSLEENCDELNTERQDLTETLSRELKEFQGKLDTIQTESANISREKENLLRELKNDVAQTGNLEREIRGLKTEIKKASGKLYIQTQRSNKLDEIAEDIQAKTQAISALSASYANVSTKNKAHDIKTRELIECLNNKNNILSGQNTQSKSVISERNTQIEANKKAANSLDNTSEDLENTIQLFSNAKTQFERTMSELADLSDSVKMTELDFLSDFTFNWSSSTLFTHRVYSNIKEVKNARQHDVEVMLQAIKEMKNQFPVYKGPKSDDIDRALSDYLNQRDELLLVPFFRQSLGVYKFGTRTFLLKLERNKILVKVGGGFLPIGQFLKTYQSIEKDKIDNKVPDYSESTKKFMGKWAEGIINSHENSPERMRASLVEAKSSHSKAAVLAVKDRSPLKRSKTNSTR